MREAASGIVVQRMIRTLLLLVALLAAAARPRAGRRAHARNPSGVADVMTRRARKPPDVCTDSACAGTAVDITVERSAVFPAIVPRLGRR